MADNENKNRGKHMKEIEDYVNNVCKAFIEPYSELLDISCRHTGSEGEMYIKTVDITDHADYYSVTELTAEEVCILVTRIILNEPTKRQLTEYEERKRVAALFR